jgi:hypothetical protein
MPRKTKVKIKSELALVNRNLTQRLDCMLSRYLDVDLRHMKTIRHQACIRACSGPRSRAGLDPRLPAKIKIVTQTWPNSVLAQRQFWRRANSSALSRHGDREAPFEGQSFH